MMQNGTEEQVILVDEQDSAIGVMGKMEAHEKGILHRAISVFIINSKGEWLLQQRHSDKYHSGGLWSNACCSHPKPGEGNKEAAERRLCEEMGLRTELKELFRFTYREDIDNGLTEHEFDHVFIGVSNDIPVVNTLEVQDWKYLSYTEIQNETKKTPENYTVWFLKIMDRVHREIQK